MHPCAPLLHGKFRGETSGELQFFKKMGGQIKKQMAVEINRRLLYHFSAKKIAGMTLSQNIAASDL